MIAHILYVRRDHTEKRTAKISVIIEDIIKRPRGGGRDEIVIVLFDRQRERTSK
jgi:hypothetical protein